MNAGFVTGRDATLIIDTGANTLAARTIHGYATAAAPANRVLVLNSEKHFDHIGGNGYFREQGIDVYGHAGIERSEDEFRSEMAEFNAAIGHPGRRAAAEEQAFYFDTRLANPNRRISSETTLELGECAVQVLLTPGHTATNISVYVPEDGVLFCGDCLTHRYIPNLEAGTRVDWVQWLASIDRIAALHPSAIVCGHGPVATGAEVDDIIESVRRILRKALEGGHVW